MNILWVIDFEYSTRLHHGGVLRFVNYARELQRLGQRVYFGVIPEPGYREETLEWMGSQVSAGVICGFVELRYQPPLSRCKPAAWAIHPGLSNIVLGRFQRETAADIAAFLDEQRIDAAILSNRRLLFVAERLSRRVPWVGDFCDCYTLYDLREVRARLRAHRFREAAGVIRRLVPSALAERYYGRRCVLSLLVSPVDKSAFDRVTGRPKNSAVLLNGTHMPESAEEVRKVPGRLIFSGNMNFIPNADAAIWFVREVFPKTIAEVPNAHLVIAGANPIPTVRALANERITVTGYIEDMGREIARSTVYVAPLISGGGFKNKVIEAIANRTCVVATSVAVEFLDPHIRQSIRVADTAPAMAESIVEVLRAPEAVEPDVESLYRRVGETFSWKARAKELLGLLERGLREIT